MSKLKSHFHDIIEAAQKGQPMTMFRVAPATPEAMKPTAYVDREGGIIHDVQVVRQGEARGHGVWVDAEFVRDIAAAGNAAGEPGLKSRFNHPNMCFGALGSMVGTLHNFRVENNDQQAIADLHLSPAAAVSPEGDLREYIFALAENHPEHFGLSIEFLHDGYLYEYDDDGNKVQWKPGADDATPPKLYLRLKNLYAADLVDTPAATDGLFSVQIFDKAFAVRVTEFFDTNPLVWRFVERNPDAVERFLAKYKDYKARRDEAGKTAKPMKKKSFWETVKSWFNTQFDIKLKDTEGNNLLVISDGEAPAVSDDVLLVPEDESEPAAAPDGNYAISGGDMDGQVLVVAEGKITEIVPAEEEPQADDSGAETPPPMSEPQFAALQQQVDALTATVEKQEKEIARLKKRPAPIHEDGDMGEDFSRGFQKVGDDDISAEGMKIYNAVKAAKDQ
ncbi:MAG: hypothetical protein ACK4Q5_06050 [Saprospiraceae bacterium]